MNHQVSTLFTLSWSDFEAMLWLSVAGALGQMCIFYTIANFGARAWLRCLSPLSRIAVCCCYYYAPIVL